MTKNKGVGEINYIFADDEYVLDVNRQFLNHDYYTDIITFDTSYMEEENREDLVAADIFISLDTVLANSREYGVAFSQELYRVMIHGILHLTGYDDDTPGNTARMHAAEDSALKVLSDRFGLTEGQKYNGKVEN